jgi:RNA polymerase subunit RPABC4/transcription elongation factor Spt4
MRLIKCPACHNDVSDEAQSCPRCGQPVTEEMKDPRLTAEIDRSELKKSSGKRALVTLGILAAIFMYFAWVSSGTGSSSGNNSGGAASTTAGNPQANVYTVTAPELYSEAVASTWHGLHKLSYKRIFACRSKDEISGYLDHTLLSRGGERSTKTLLALAIRYVYDPVKTGECVWIKNRGQRLDVVSYDIVNYQQYRYVISEVRVPGKRGRFWAMGDFLRGQVVPSSRVW